jgi:hypothetical protein
MRVPESTFRARVVKGWAFRDHTPEEIASIRHFLATGEMDEMFPYRWAHEWATKLYGGK